MRKICSRLGALSLVLALLPTLPVRSAAPSPTLPDVVAAPMVFEGALPASPAVEMDWFSDAVFIGDARAQGLQDSGLISGGAWLVSDGFNVRSARTEALFTLKGEKVTLAQALEAGGYTKVYVITGINEASWMDENTFRAELAGLMDDLRKLLPGVGIYLSTILPVTVVRATARTPDNTLIATRNTLLRRLAQEERVYLLDPTGPFTAASGGLESGYSDSDGLRLNQKGNELLLRYLRTHTAGD